MLLSEKFDKEADRELERKANRTIAPAGSRGKTLQQYMKDYVYSGDGSAQAKEDENLKLCACGDDNPKFSAGKGIWFCEACVQKKKEKFDKLLDRFVELAEEYDTYHHASMNKAERSQRKVWLLK